MERVRVGVIGTGGIVKAVHLPWTETLDAVTEQAADLVERVVFMAAVTQLFLLDAAADLVEHLCAEADDVEGVHHRGRVGQDLGSSSRMALA